MTRGTRKKFKSRPTREFSRRIRAFSSSPPSPEHGLLIGGEVGGTRKERKGHRTYSVLSYKWLFSEGTGRGGERDLLEEAEVKATKILATVTEVWRDKRKRGAQ